MPLAKGGRAVPVLPKDLTHAGRILGHDAVVARIAGSKFHNDAGVNAMVVPAGQHCGARGRAQRSGMETIEAKAGIGEFLEHRCIYRTAEHAGMAESDIVQKDHENVRRAVWRPRDGRLCRF